MNIVSCLIISFITWLITDNIILSGIILWIITNDMVFSTNHEINDSLEYTFFELSPYTNNLIIYGHSGQIIKEIDICFNFNKFENLLLTNKDFFNKCTLLENL